MKFLKGLMVLITVIVALIALYHSFFGPSASDKERRVSKGKQEEAAGKFVQKKAPKQRPPAPSAGRGEAKVAIIIDDIGYNLRPLKKLLAIEAPLAFAILPFTPHAAEAAEVIHRAKREGLLHLPMEPQDPRENPGPGALYRWMQEADIIKQLNEDLAAFPYVAGVNNHMGSAFMEDEEKLYIVLRELQEKGLFFIDSRTTPRSRTEEVAKKINIRYASRELFLDNNQEQEIIFQNLMTFLAKHRRGTAVIIGHPYPGTIEALKRAVPIMEAKGIRIVPPAELVKAKATREYISKKD